jgi:alkylation response protein AidB-like acyl-CoA dehydrogenase
LSVQRATEIANDVLFPAALDVDRADHVAASHLDLLAAEGFYGIAAQPDTDFAAMAATLEAFASGCLTTAFVWLQHHGAVGGAAHTDTPGLRERWLEPLARGERRAGLALAGVRPGAKRLRVREIAGDYVVDGEVPWVTGWDMIDVMLVAACMKGTPAGRHRPEKTEGTPAGRHRPEKTDDMLHFLLVDTAGVRASPPLDLVAARASRTVTVRFDEHRVTADRLIGTAPYAEWIAGEAPGSALNGFLALGVAGRCARLIETADFDDELASCRAALLAADAQPDAIPAARAAASDLAMRAAARLMVHTGSRAVLRDQHAQRLVREAAFLLVFGTRPAIRDALLTRLR